MVVCGQRDVAAARPVSAKPLKLCIMPLHKLDFYFSGQPASDIVEEIVTICDGVLLSE